MINKNSKFFSKPAINTNLTSEVCVAEKLRLVAKYGFDAVMLNMNTQKNEPPMSEQAELCKQNGLDICCVHLPFDNMGKGIDANMIWQDEHEYFDIISDSIEFCGRFEIPIAVFHLTAGGEPPQPNDIGFERIEKLLEIAKRNGVVIALENKRYTNHNGDTFEKINSPNLAFCYDIGHENIFQPNLKMPQLMTKKYPLVMIHLHDNNGKTDQHKLPFDGKIDFNLIKLNLIDVNYQNKLMLECRKEHSSTYRKLTVEQFVELAYQRAIEFQNMFKN